MATATLRFPGDGLKHPWSVLTARIALPPEPSPLNKITGPSTYVALGVLDLVDQVFDLLFAFPARRLLRDEWDIDVEAGDEWRRISVRGFANARRTARELQERLDAGGWTDLDDLIAACTA